MKRLNLLTIIFTISLLFIPVFVFALIPNPVGRLESVSKIGGYKESALYVEEGLALLIGEIIKSILSLLGIIFLILLIYAGFLWLTARGDSEIVTKAKDVMSNAVIGIVIVLLSYAITSYVVDKLTESTIQSSIQNVIFS